MALPNYTPPPAKATSSIPVIVAACSMAVLLTVFVIVISIVRPDSDNINLIGIVIAAVAPTTVALLAYLKTLDNSVAVQEVRQAVNGRQTQLLAMTETASYAQGLADGTTAGTIIAKDLVATTASQLRQGPVVLP